MGIGMNLYCEEIDIGKLCNSLKQIRIVLNEIKKYYELGYFTVDFESLLYNDKTIKKIPLENYTEQQELFNKFNFVCMPKELEDGNVYIETEIYLFALWAYKYLFNEEYNYELTHIKFPGLFQFFKNSLYEDFTQRCSDFDELLVYLDIAIDEIEGKYYDKEDFFAGNFELITSTGMLRYENQDTIGTKGDDEIFIAIVADGMGGGSCGDIASKMAVNNVLRYYDELKNTKEDIDTLLKDIVMDTHEKIIYYKNNHHLKSMGTTLSVVVLKEGKLYFAHVGDSRIYIKNKHTLTWEQITLDHSLAEVNFREGKVNEEEKEKMAKNVLKYILGSEGLTLEVINTVADYKPIYIDDIESIVVCCDGCWDLIDKEAFSSDVKTLFCNANKLVTHDNFSVIKINIDKKAKKLSQHIVNEHKIQQNNDVEIEKELVSKTAVSLTKKPKEVKSFPFFLRKIGVFLLISVIIGLVIVEYRDTKKQIKDDRNNTKIALDKEPCTQKKNQKDVLATSIIDKSIVQNQNDNNISMDKLKQNNKILEDSNHTTYDAPGKMQQDIKKNSFTIPKVLSEVNKSLSETVNIKESNQTVQEGVVR